jgi:DNA-binding XRE family transcriptional regulator
MVNQRFRKCKLFFAIWKKIFKKFLAFSRKPHYYWLMRASGERIMEYRMAKNLTRKELADRIGVTRQAIEHWERNGVPTIKSLVKIARGLEIPPELLLEK